MVTSSSNSIALLIDADNAPASKVDFIISELATQGTVNIRRAYGNWKKPGLSNWAKALHEHAIQPRQFFDLVKGKNATDMGLLIDAMDILYTKDVQTFGLVSSDCDFTSLVQRLREDGKAVIGFGGQTTPEAFINSCTRFLYLDEPREPKAENRAKAGPKKPMEGQQKLVSILRRAVRAVEDEDGWARLGPVGSHISNQGPFDHRTYGFKKLSDLFATIDLFEMKTERSSGRPVISVRLKAQAKKAGTKKAAKKLSAKKSQRA